MTRKRASTCRVCGGHYLEGDRSDHVRLHEHVRQLARLAAERQRARRAKAKEKA